MQSGIDRVAERPAVDDTGQTSTLRWIKPSSSENAVFRVGRGLFGVGSNMSGHARELSNFGNPGSFHPSQWISTMLVHTVRRHRKTDREGLSVSDVINRSILSGLEDFQRLLGQGGLKVFRGMPE